MDVSTVRQYMVCFNSGDCDSGSSLLVQMFMSETCRLLFITGANADLIVVLKKTVLCSREFSLTNTVTVLCVSIVISMKINRIHCFQRELHSCHLKKNDHQFTALKEIISSLFLFLFFFPSVYFLKGTHNSFQNYNFSICDHTADLLSSCSTTRDVPSVNVTRRAI